MIRSPWGPAFTMVARPSSSSEMNMACSVATVSVSSPVCSERMRL